jgi:hypothetical protein
MRARQVAGLANDPGGDVEIEQEVLAERLLRPQLVPRDDVAQRRQGGDGVAKAVAGRAQSRMSI